MSKPDSSGGTDDQLVQCETCLEMVPESDAITSTVPGATLVFCPECSEPNPFSYYGGL